VLIKQFTHALTWASDPAKALASFDHFLDLIVKDQARRARTRARLRRNKRTFPLLRRLLGASDFLWEDFLRRQHSNLFHCSQNTGCAPDQPQATLRKELDRLSLAPQKTVREKKP